MAFPDESMDDVFKPGGSLRTDLLSDTAAKAVDESIRMARETRWDSVRSPHVFMGLLAACDPGVRDWGKRLGADLPKLLGQFQELFHQEEGAYCATPTTGRVKISAIELHRWIC